MNWQSTITTKSKAEENREWVAVSALRRLPQYTLCAGMGMVAGTTGVSVAIGMILLAQILLFPAVSFAPAAIPTTIFATFMGVVIAWLVSRVAGKISANFAYYSTEQGMQVMLVFSALTALLQTFLFTRGL